MPSVPRLLAHDKCVICGSECPGDAIQAAGFASNHLDTSVPRHGGGIISLSFGYGSRHDVEYVYAAICDECAKTLIETAAEPFTSGGALGTTFQNAVDMREANDEAQDNT